MYSLEGLFRGSVMGRLVSSLINFWWTWEVSHHTGTEKRASLSRKAAVRNFGQWANA